MATGCERCGKKLDLLRSGRVPSYCSTRCRMAAHRAKQLPAQLRTRDRWVRWAPDKRPITAEGWPASSTDAKTWTSHSKIREFSRIGFVLGQGIGCIDLDHCLIDGKPTPAAAQFLALVPQTYIEVSPSGDGLHIWGLMPEAAGTRRKTDDGLSVETYSRSRYITVTGRRFADSPARLADLSCMS